MAAPTLPLVSVEEYLNTSYHPDMEYVDGVLVEKGMPTILHGLLAAVLITWFRTRQREFGYKVIDEPRTEIAPLTRYRVPDVVLCEPPAPPGKVIAAAPVAVFEILSPTDRMSDTLARFRDFERIGVRYILQFDPVQHTMHRFHHGALAPCETFSFRFSNGRELEFDSKPIFAELALDYRELTGEN